MARSAIFAARDAQMVRAIIFAVGAAIVLVVIFYVVYLSISAWQRAAAERRAQAARVTATAQAQAARAAATAEAPIVRATVEAMGLNPDAMGVGLTDGALLVFVPAGEFTMGSDDGVEGHRFSRRRRAHAARPTCEARYRRMNSSISPSRTLTVSLVS